MESQLNTRRLIGAITALVLLLGACGSDDDADSPAAEVPEADDPLPVAGDDVETPEEEGPCVEGEPECDPAGDTEADPQDLPADTEDDPGSGLVQNFFDIDGEQYPITINTCFGMPEVELEVIAHISGSDEAEVYAYVYSTGEGDELILSSFRVNDDERGLAWSNESGEGASNLTLGDRRISGEAPVSSPDGDAAVVVFDFACPG